MDQQNELFIVLSNVCNFKCAHCVTTSSPTPEKKVVLSSSEITQIISWIKTQPRIKRIHFSGGEPTLHIDIISEFQSQLPNLEYAMTSNGWFGRNPEQIFNKIKLDVVYFSYDKFHKPFIDPETLKNTLKESLNRGIRTYVKITASDANDFVLLTEVNVEGVQVILNTLVDVGRANQLKLSTNTPSRPEYWNASCPSLGEERVDNLERFLYFAGKGFTPCCGPLVESENADPNLVFSSLENNYFEDNKLYNLLKDRSFNEQVKDKELFKNDCKTPCSICSAIYGKKKVRKPNSLNSNKIFNEPTLLPIQEFLSEDEITFYNTHYKPAYLFKKVADNLPKESSSLLIRSQLEYGLNVEPINEENADLATNVFMASFKNLHTQNVTSEYLASLESKLPLFLKASKSSLLYMLNRTPVGVLGLWLDYDHPLLREKVNHIGVIGYDRTLLNIDQARALKKHFSEIINESIENSTNRSFTARIDLFNFQSINLFSKLGFSLIGLELIPI